MIKKNKNKWRTILLAIGFLLMSGSSVWAKSDATKAITSQEIRESAENYLINHLDWNPESMDIEINYQAKDLVVPAGKVVLDFGRKNIARGVGRIPLTVLV